MAGKKKKTQYLVQTILTKDVYEALIAVVTRDRRSVANYLRKLIEEDVNKGLDAYAVHMRQQPASKPGEDER